MNYLRDNILFATNPMENDYLFPSFSPDFIYLFKDFRVMQADSLGRLLDSSTYFEIVLNDVK